MDIAVALRNDSFAGNITNRITKGLSQASETIKPSWLKAPAAYKCTAFTSDCLLKAFVKFAIVTFRLGSCYSIKPLQVEDDCFNPFLLPILSFTEGDIRRR